MPISAKIRSGPASPTLEVVAEPVPGMRVVHDDDDIVVVDKPVGVAAHPSVGWTGPNVLAGLKAAGYRISTSGASERQGIVSRLDVGTSGLMVVCKSERAYSVLKRAFKEKMKAVSAKYDVPDAAVEAIRAGCDAVLVCSGDVDLQGRTLEALVRAVESGRIPAKRVDDAFVRLKRAKDRFLTGDRRSPSGRIKSLRQVLGREEHQLVAAEMAAYL